MGKGLVRVFSLWPRNTSISQRVFIHEILHLSQQTLRPSYSCMFRDLTKAYICIYPKFICVDLKSQISCKIVLPPQISIFSSDFLGLTEAVERRSVLFGELLSTDG